jgi:glycosyltransferase involved in cell wall biosynthesis
MSVTVIIPTTGAPVLKHAIESVLNQTYKDTKCYVVCDGLEYMGKVRVICDEYAGDSRLHVTYLPINVGANGFYGHRIYAAFTHLVDTKYVMYLDQDCWFNPVHIEQSIKKIEDKNLDWSYSLRNITDPYGEFLCYDDCESLGKWPVFSGNYNHIDTNCYCIKTEVAVKLAQVWHGGWGQDRVWLQVLSQHFPKFDCTGEYTVNYRVAGNDGSVKPEFFLHGNEVMNKRYNGVFPWRSKI